MHVCMCVYFLLWEFLKKVCMFISSTYILLEEKKKTLQKEILIYQLFL